MSVKLNQIKMQGVLAKDKVLVRAKLEIISILEAPIPVIIRHKNGLMVDGVVESHTKEMKEVIMQHIYGDLVEPINELSTLAQFHITGMNDEAEIASLKRRITNIMKGL